MSSRTVIVSRARPGAMSISRMPSRRLAWSSVHIASAQRCARVSAGLDTGALSPSEGSEFTKAPPAPGDAAEPRAGPVPAGGVGPVQGIEQGNHPGRADPVAPLQRSDGVTDPQAHRDVDIGGGGNATTHDVNGLVDEHGNGPGDK